MSEGLEINVDNPLEELLEERVGEKNSHHYFPHTGTNRFELYKAIKSKLQQDYYRDIDGALTADSCGSAYTRHDIGHVDDVIRKAGQILGANSDTKKPAIRKLKPYEIFVLLIACLIHDAGNIYGRSGHANRVRKILKDVSDAQLNQYEISLISKIARAHGGKTPSGSYDTIGGLDDKGGVEHITIRPRYLAAVLRFADELAENPRRANRRDAEGSKFPNLYCSSISVRVDYESRRISLNFVVSDGECALYETDESGESMYFLDYISKRVAKTELERRYCDRHLRGQATFEVIRVAIELLKNDEEWETIHFELRDEGYPRGDNLEEFRKQMIDGSEIAKKYEALCTEKGHDDD